MKRRIGSPIEIMIKSNRLKREFFIRDVLDVAPGLIGKDIFIRRTDGTISSFCITEVEAYRGEEDKACHASKGRTARTEIMYHEGGYLYVYFIYGMYWMLNIVTAVDGVPQAVLIRGVENLHGPGRLARAMRIDKSFYGEDLVTSVRIWLVDNGRQPIIKTAPRIGIDYSGEYWKSRPWRYYQ
jgi:DNA-3-methyladenine glycosylase